MNNAKTISLGLLTWFRFANDDKYSDDSLVNPPQICSKSFVSSFCRTLGNKASHVFYQVVWSQTRNAELMLANYSSRILECIR